jgi:hypothetical protein
LRKSACAFFTRSSSFLYSADPSFASSNAAFARSFSISFASLRVELLASSMFSATSSVASPI